MSSESDKGDKKPSAVPSEKIEEIQSMQQKKGRMCRIKKGCSKKNTHHERPWENPFVIIVSYNSQKMFNHLMESFRREKKLIIRLIKLPLLNVQCNFD